MAKSQNLLIFGFYDDFARFFFSIKKNLELKSPQSKVLYVSNNLSGFIFWRLRDKNVKLTPTCSNKSTGNYETIAENPIIKKSLDYHRKETTFKKNEQLYLKRALRYCDFFSQQIKAFEPTFVIVSGDSRMSCSILKSLCIEKNIPFYIFEQGPFSTTIMDRQGVNANASIREHWSLEKIDFSNEIKYTEKIRSFIERTKPKKYTRSPFYRILDLILNTLPFRFFIPIDLKERSLPSLVHSKIKSKLKNSHREPAKVPDKTNTQQILLGLQVPDDANFRVHCPLYQTHYEILRDVVNKLPPHGTQLIVREHPLYRGAYESELYALINSDPRVTLDTNKLAATSYQSCDKIILNNSMMGVELLLSNKPILNLGRSYYEQVVETVDKISLEQFINQEISVRHTDRISFLNSLCFHYLIEGHFRDKDLSFTEKIVDLIEKETT